MSDLFSFTNVRAIMGIVFALAIVVGFFMGNISSDVFMTVAGAAIAFYFNKEQNKENVDAAIQSALTARVVSLDAKAS